MLANSIDKFSLIIDMLRTHFTLVFFLGFEEIYIHVLHVQFMLKHNKQQAQYISMFSLKVKVHEDKYVGRKKIII